MCAQATKGGETVTWCGTGWTGQPLVWERPDGITEVIFGAYDRNVHFVDAETGLPTRPRFEVGDIVKGSPTLDPDGYPLLYFGARDNLLRIVALDRDAPTELWARSAYESLVRWNDDWDSNPVIVDDVMYEGGENGWFYAFRLNRGYGEDGLVTVSPEVLIEIPTWNDELLRREGGNQVSVENSAALFEDRVFFANSAGRVMGLDISGISEAGAGEAVPPLVFDFWVGEDVDATIVVDGDGYIYAAAEQELFSARGSGGGAADEARSGQARRPAGVERGGASQGRRGRRHLGHARLGGRSVVRRHPPPASCWRWTWRPARWCGGTRSDRTLGRRPSSSDRPWWWRSAAASWEGCGHTR